ncbi:HAMP domain-containing sensor histidine kinase [Nocardioides sp. YIM 152315]|uniref:sensor histidine kinase n=1 Tax=Nocardioides sp. YIM 152315 TaxID=3031760 RepID=UPI0023DB6A49|nr:HAMP domain-containing sensor histidine kinase [Nocardioides sp. YIM 152315]MDF1605760.1 ATP-binding protein [Nocardioides sp. YIM 152315]
MDDVRVPWRRSLLVRLVGIGALIALLAVVAATWATVRATTVAVRESQQDSLHTDARVYDELVGYAATHARWTGADSLVVRLAREAGRHLTITDEAGRVLVDSEGDRAARSPSRSRATVDAFAIDPVLATGADPEVARVVPAAVPVECARSSGCRLWTVGPPDPMDARVVPLALVERGPPTEELAAKVLPRRWAALREDVDACLVRVGLPRSRDLTGTFGVVVGFRQQHGVVARCAADARRAWYDGHVAAPALLYIGDEGSADVFWDLSTAGRVRIALLAGGVLLVTLLLCLLLAGSVVRPLRRMAAAAHRAGDGDLDARVPAGRRDEVGEVARAFNEMADRRQQLEEARRRLVSDVSHELRTPIANVRGWIEAAEDGLVEPDDRLLASLHEETLLLQRLVDDLHDLALGDAGELRLDAVDVDVADLLDQVAESFRGASGAAGVGVRVEVEPGARVHADPVRLRQAVGNLVANALRRTRVGGTVTLRGRTGVLEVVDTGEGIPADDLPHVFDRFRRADPARSRATGGSGLGLAIVRQIAEAHGGTATISSAVGVGTSVRLVLSGS